jgi:Fur family ferric uptake transcriptional regulator
MAPGPRIAEETLDHARGKLDAYLAHHGLKHTKQREVILEAFLKAEGHVTSEDLYETVHRSNPEIGAATVYRALKLFCEARIATPTHFREGVTLYEHQVTHHDHLICLGCGEIVEFECEMIEDAQQRIADTYGFRLTNHRHDLYGYCPGCRRQGRDDG